MPEQAATRISDVIRVSPVPAVISLGGVERLRDELRAGTAETDELHALLGGYSLGNEEARAAFEAMTRSLGRQEQRGDAFLLQGVYGTGKSHLVSVLTLLCAHPGEAWPAFLATHPDYDRVRGGFKEPRLVVTVPLDEHAAATHPLEHIVLSRIEEELDRRHGLRVALTEEAHLLDLVDRYVAPQAGAGLDRAAERGHGAAWQELRERSPGDAAEIALTFLKESAFPLDWHRSRAEAWGELRRTLQSRGIDGPVVLLDELGTFLAGRDRRGLNADASFLQYLAQRAAGDRCWLICVTQRGLAEVGDIDRRTLRQLRDRFRPAFTLDLSELDWVIAHRLVRRRDEDTFRATMRRVHEGYSTPAGEPPFSAAELERSYPLSPLCLDAIQHAAERCLSRTRSAVRLLQEMLVGQGWLERPAERLITPDAAFELFRGEMALSASGQRHLHAYEVTMSNASQIAPRREEQLAVVMKSLCLLGLGETRWSEQQLRSSLVGCARPELWQEPSVLRELLQALHRRGAYVERARREAEGGDEYYVDVSSDASERIRQRLAELVAELTPGDSRVARGALEACREPVFPLAALAEPRSLGVMWFHARRFVSVVCRDLSQIDQGELANLAGELAAPHVREDGRLFLALPTIDRSAQEAAWRSAAAAADGRFAAGLVAWLPRELSETEREHLVEHAALADMVADGTLPRRRDKEFREKLRDRWADSEAELRRMLQRAYYDGSVVGADGTDVIEPERLSALFGDWEETLAAIFSTPFRGMFPRFPTIAPDRRLVGRAQTNQIIDQFIRPGGAELPPASTLEAHLFAYAAPLGLVEGEERHPRLALKHHDLVAAAIEAAPARAAGEQIDPHETLRYGEFAGRLAKSEWGLTHEQSELVIAALIRTGHLAALDAFLQPARLDAIAAPLGDALPYVMRGAPLDPYLAGQVKRLWQAALGGGDVEWSLPVQEQVWGDMIAWAGRVSHGLGEGRAAMARAAETFGHARASWTSAEQALGRTEAVAARVDGALTSRDGLTLLATAATQMPGALEETARLLAQWRQCERLLGEHMDELARLHALVKDERVQAENASLLAREQRSLLDRFADVDGLVSDPVGAQAAAVRWLESYRRHYLAWHSRAHAPARFEGLLKLGQSSQMETARRLARVGLEAEAAALVEADLGRALGRRCLAGDPLPAGHIVCPVCDLRLGQEVELPDAAELARRVEETLDGQRAALRSQSGLLRRRLGGCGEERVRRAVELLLDAAGGGSTKPLCPLLSDAVITWLRQQVERPRSRRRELRRLEESLRGKDLTRRDVIRIVEEWLEAGDGDYIEIV